MEKEGLLKQDVTERGPLIKKGAVIGRRVSELKLYEGLRCLQKCFAHCLRITKDKDGAFSSFVVIEQVT